MSRVQESVHVRAFPQKPSAASVASQRAHSLDEKLDVSQQEVVSRRGAQSVPSPGVGN